MKTKISNNSGHGVVMKEGTGGVYRALCRISSHPYVIVVDPNATYKEYVLVVEDVEQSLTLSTDDLNEYKEITIKEKGEGDVKWEGVHRNKALEDSTPSRDYSRYCIVM
jgi:hypothetical protein